MKRITYLRQAAREGVLRDVEPHKVAEAVQGGGELRADKGSSACATCLQCDIAILQPKPGDGIKRLNVLVHDEEHIVLEVLQPDAVDFLQNQSNMNSEMVLCDQDICDQAWC